MDLRRLQDLEEIRALTHAYAHYVWQKNVEGIVSLFAPDGAMDMGDGTVLRGREALREAYARTFADQDFFPFVHNHLVEIEGDRARGVCYLDVRARTPQGLMTGAGWYEDEYIRVGGRWLFALRRLRMSFYLPMPGQA